jgi:superfamily II DNA or RNA helicase/SAM-dependent methyltransferase
MSSSLSLRDYQHEAIEGIRESLEENDRCLLKMWCGTGKTRVFFFYLLQEHLPLSVVVFPSLSLVHQFRKDYLENPAWKDRVEAFDVLVVCTDGTTDADTILDFVESDDERSKIIVVTYQSFHLLVDVEIDLMVFDEAHHVVEDRVRDLVFSEDRAAAKMLFITATPEKKNGIDMMDGDCGPMAYEFTYCDAVRAGVCNAFQVVPFAVAPRFQGEDRTRTILSQLEKDAAAVGHGRVLTFHGLAEAESKSRSDVLRFVQTAQGYFSQENPNVTVRGITSSTPKEDREKLLQAFESCPEGTMSLLASCNTMGEGVDTKTANKVVFFDPKTSHKSVAQAIGRVTRPQPGGVSDVHVIMDMDLEALQEIQDSTTMSAEEKDAKIREALGKSMGITLNVFSWLKQEDPEYATLCLHYPNRFSPNEVHQNLERQGYVVAEEAETVEEMFDSGATTLEEIAEEKEGAIEVHTQSMETPIEIIGEGDIVARVAEGEEEGTYHAIFEGNGRAQGVKPPNRKPLFRVPRGSNGFRIMWKIVADGMGRSLLEFDAGGVTTEDRVQALLNYVEKHKTIPSQRVKDKFTKNGVEHEIQIGKFWMGIKSGKNKDLHNDLLKNNVLKADYDACQKKIEENITPSDRAQALLNYVEKHKKKPPEVIKEKFTKNGVEHEISIGVFWNNIKQGQSKDLHNDLLKNNVLKADYDAYLKKKEQKPEIPITPSDRAQALLNYVEKHKKKPPEVIKEKFTKNGVEHEISIGVFWNNIKQGKNKDLHNDLLKNDVLKDDYDAYLKKKSSIPPQVSFPQAPVHSSEELLRVRDPLPPCHLETDFETMTMKQWHQKVFTMRSDRLGAFFAGDPRRWRAYHETREQTTTHGYDPLDRVIQEMSALRHRGTKTVADLGSGMGKLARRFKNSKKYLIKSLDYVALPDVPESYACDISRCEILENDSVNIVVLCLALWGTNKEETLRSAYRVLETNGILYLVEPTRRWTETAQAPMKSLVDLVVSIGFTVVTSEIRSEDQFFMFSFFKLLKSG